MKRIIFAALFLFCVVSICHAQENSLVYLKADSVSVSSFDATPDWAPPQNSQAVIDGDPLTRWSSNYTDNQWLAIDFGAPKVLSKVVIFWEAAHAIEYNILVSQDNQAWQIVRPIKDGRGKIEETEFAPVKARYVKILGLKRFNPDWGISMWEAVCLGPAGDNPQDKPLAEALPQIAEKLGAKPAQAAPETEKPVASPGAVGLKEFQKGVVYTSWGKTELGSAASDQTLEHLKKTGVRHLGIMVVWLQETIEETGMSPDPKDTPDDAALAHAINKAHSLGMKVMLKPHVDVKTGQWRGDIIPSKEWFASYKNYLLYYAKLAEQYNVEVFSVGTELVNTTTSNWQAEWEAIIKEVKGVFSGQLVYSANWNEYQTVGFWNDLDQVGIDAYFPLTQKKDPTRDELISGWKSNAEEIDMWLKANKINKPVVFNEVGYCSADGTNIQPWSVLSSLSERFIDQQEQADALDALFSVCTKYPWFKGLYWWNYFPQERWSPLGYTIKGKKAEEIFSEWLKKIQ